MRHEFFELAEAPKNAPLDTRIGYAVAELAAQVGITDKKSVDAAIERELSRRIAASVFNSLTAEGITIAGAHLLDDGAGLGMLSVEAAARGAIPVAVEPGAECCALAKERLHGTAGTTVVASGEELPFADASFDLVLSVQVLEHVQTPIAYLREAFRVLKPGGHLYLSCENYLSFREPHYDVAWLPLLPKSLGAVYLRIRGRPTAFLKQSITYTTGPWVSRMLRSCGFVSLREQRLTARFGSNALARTVIALQNCRTLFKPGVYALVWKPL